jgi:hypothetical protein
MAPRRDTGRPARHLALAAGLVAVMAGCSALRPARDPAPTDAATAPAVASAVPPLPAKFSRRVGTYAFNHDFPLAADQPLFSELADLREQITRQLRLPESSTVVQVYLFEDQERYERFMHARYPDLPRRRAFFVAQPRGLGGSDDLLVYTYWGPHIRQDLRHELTHALLHSVLKDVPLWLDEGLAEYFELPPEYGGVNPQHLRHLQRVNGPVDLARLEQFSQVGQMERAEYREAWAWVHLMLHGRAEARDVLLGYLQQLRTTANPGPLLPRLQAVHREPGQSLKLHLALLAPPDMIEQASFR